MFLPAKKLRTQFFCKPGFALALAFGWLVLVLVLALWPCQPAGLRVVAFVIKTPLEIDISVETRDSWKTCYVYLSIFEIWFPKPLNLEASPQTYGSRDLAPKALDLEDTPQPIDLEAWVPNLEI